MVKTVFDNTSVVDELWKQTVSTVLMPTTLPDGRYTSAPDTDPLVVLRSHERHRCQSRGILIYENELLGIITKDLSKSGIGFYSPVKLAKKSTAMILLPGPHPLKVTIHNSRQISLKCYFSGASFLHAERSQ